MTAAMNSIALIAGDQRGGAHPHAVHYGLIAIVLLGIAVLGLAHPRAPHSATNARAVGPGRADLSPATAERFLVPIALVSSAAAAGVHAAMAPPHFRESAMFGVFFVLAAALQLTWASLVMVRRDTTIMMLGALGNAAVITLWGVTRTIGLPFGLLPEPEAVGVWDLACAAWEIVVVVGCLVLVTSSRPHPQALLWREWHRSARVYAGASVLSLTAMAVTGAG